MKVRFNSIIRPLLVITCLFTSINVNAKIGWFASGADSELYNMGIDNAVKHSGVSSGFIEGQSDKAGIWGTYMQHIKADQYLGKRIKFSAFLKIENVTESAGMWARVDSPKKSAVSFDNMDNRPLKGDMDWNEYSIVLDVPEDSSRISFGLLLSGKGKSWIDDFSITIVDENTPTTDLSNDEEEEAYLDAIGAKRKATSNQLDNMDFSKSAFELNDSWWASKFVKDKFAVKIEEDNNDKRIAYIGSDSVLKDDMGVFLQKIYAKDFAGKRVEVSGTVKSKDIEEWAGLWLRTTSPQDKTLTFNNMRNNPIVGSSDWKEVSFELDVPENTETMTFGTVLLGIGHLWLKSFNIKPIGEATKAEGEPKEELASFASLMDFES